MLIVTTTTACWALDAVTGRAAQFQAGNGVYYGISFDADNIYIAARQAAVGSDQNIQDNSILVFDRKLRLIQVLHSPHKIRDVHQIFQHGGRLFVTSTFDDCILECDLATHRWSRWMPFGESPLGQDVNHINSVYISGNTLFLAGLYPLGWFAEFKLDNRTLIRRVDLGVGTHNVWLQNGHVAVCSSLTSEIWEEGGARQSYIAGAWVRGIARERGLTYVGATQDRVSPERARSDSAIIGTDCSFVFRGYGMVHDVRSTDCDSTHHGTSIDVTVDWMRFWCMDTKEMPQGFSLMEINKIHPNSVATFISDPDLLPGFPLPFTSCAKEASDQ